MYKLFSKPEIVTTNKSNILVFLKYYDPNTKKME